VLGEAVEEATLSLEDSQAHPDSTGTRLTRSSGSSSEEKTLSLGSLTTMMTSSAEVSLPCLVGSRLKM